MVGNVGSNHRSGPDKSEGPDGVAAHDGAVSAQGGTKFDLGFPKLAFSLDESSGIVHIREYHGWAAEYLVFELDHL